MNSAVRILTNKFCVHFLSHLFKPHKEYKLRSSSVRIFLRTFATSCTFGLNIPLSCTLKAPQFTTLFFFYNLRDQLKSHEYEYTEIQLWLSMIEMRLQTASQIRLYRNWYALRKRVYTRIQYK